MSISSDGGAAYLNSVLKGQQVEIPSGVDCRVFDDETFVVIGRERTEKPQLVGIAGVEVIDLDGEPMVWWRTESITRTGPDQNGVVKEIRICVRSYVPFAAISDRVSIEPPPISRQPRSRLSSLAV
jgi:hypothetical protein